MQKYNYKNKELNVEIDCYLDNENNIWFRGRDIANILEYKNAYQALRIHVENEDKTIVLKNSTMHNREYKATYINESGFYSLILSSKKPEAKEFKHWVTSKVLPSIRKYGQYKIFNDRNNNMLLIESENDLHYKIVSFIRKNMIMLL